MHRLVVEGGRPLMGTVQASGSKNAALPLLFATLLAPGTHQIRRIPALADTATARSLLGRFGCSSLDERGGLLIDTTQLTECTAPPEVVDKMRASVLMMGPLLARLGEVRMPRPGGCAIGARPIDEHLRGLSALGCTFTERDGEVHGVVRRLRGAKITLRVPSVTGTENLLMAAVLAEGSTQIHRAAREPEVIELCDFLNAMGAQISGIGSSDLRIEGVPALRPLRQSWQVLPDRIETGTWLCAAALTGGDITVYDAAPRALHATLDVLRVAGCTLQVDAHRVRCRRSGPLAPIQIVTGPYPAFPTDMQPMISAVASLAKGRSVIRETLFEDRFHHAQELNRMGARILANHDTLHIDGVPRLKGAELTASDLRAGAALLVAALAAEGTSQIRRCEHLERGYEQILDKVRTLGGTIRREAEPDPTPSTPPVLA